MNSFIPSDRVAAFEGTYAVKRYVMYIYIVWKDLWCMMCGPMVNRIVGSMCGAKPVSVTSDNHNRRNWAWYDSLFWLPLYKWDKGTRVSWIVIQSTTYSYLCTAFCNPYWCFFGVYSFSASGERGPKKKRYLWGMIIGVVRQPSAGRANQLNEVV